MNNENSNKMSFESEDDSVNNVDKGCTNNDNLETKNSELDVNSDLDSSFEVFCVKDIKSLQKKAKNEDVSRNPTEPSTSSNKVVERFEDDRNGSRKMNDFLGLFLNKNDKIKSNGLIEKGSDEKKTEKINFSEIGNLISKCPLCLKVFDDMTTHIKNCFTRKNLSREQLHNIIELQFKQDREREAMGLPLVPEKASQKRGTKRKLPTTGCGSSYDLALALSKSLQEHERQELMQEAHMLTEAGLTEEAHATLKTLERYGFASSSQPSASIKTTGRGKSVKSAKVSLLLSRTEEDRLAILTKKIAMVLVGDDKPEESDIVFQDKCTPKSSMLRKCYVETNDLWSLASTPKDVDKNEFYVEALKNVITPSNTEPGRLLQHVSQVPGRSQTPPPQAISLDATTVAEAEGIESQVDNTDISLGNISVADTGTTVPIAQTVSRKEILLSKYRTKFDGTFVNNWKSVFGVKDYSDLKVFVRNGCEIPIHSIVLKARCADILDSITVSSDNTSVGNVIDWKDISYDTAELFLKFIYCNEFEGLFNQPVSVVKELSILVDRYKVNVLLELINELNSDFNDNSSVINRDDFNVPGSVGETDSDYNISNVVNNNDVPSVICDFNSVRPCGNKNQLDLDSNVSVELNPDTCTVTTNNDENPDRLLNHSASVQPDDVRSVDGQCEDENLCERSRSPASCDSLQQSLDCDSDSTMICSSPTRRKLCENYVIIDTSQRVKMKNECAYDDGDVLLSDSNVNKYLENNCPIKIEDNIVNESTNLDRIEVKQEFDDLFNINCDWDVEQEFKMSEFDVLGPNVSKTTMPPSPEPTCSKYLSPTRPLDSRNVSPDVYNGLIEQGTERNNSIRNFSPQPTCSKYLSPVTFNYSNCQSPDIFEGDSVKTTTPRVYEVCDDDDDDDDDDIAEVNVINLNNSSFNGKLSSNSVERKRRIQNIINYNTENKSKRRLLSVPASNDKYVKDSDNDVIVLENENTSKNINTSYSSLNTDNPWIDFNDAPFNDLPGSFVTVESSKDVCNDVIAYEDISRSSPKSDSSSVICLSPEPSHFLEQGFNKSSKQSTGFVDSTKKIAAVDYTSLSRRKLLLSADASIFEDLSDSNITTAVKTVEDKFERFETLSMLTKKFGQNLMELGKLHKELGDYGRTKQYAVESDERNVSNCSEDSITNGMQSVNFSDHSITSILNSNNRSVVNKKELKELGKKVESTSSVEIVDKNRSDYNRKLLQRISSDLMLPSQSNDIRETANVCTVTLTDELPRDVNKMNEQEIKELLTKYGLKNTLSLQLSKEMLRHVFERLYPPVSKILLMNHNLLVKEVKNICKAQAEYDRNEENFNWGRVGKVLESERQIGKSVDPVNDDRQQPGTSYGRVDNIEYDTQNNVHENGDSTDDEDRDNFSHESDVEDIEVIPQDINSNPGTTAQKVSGEQLQGVVRECIKSNKNLYLNVLLTKVVQLKDVVELIKGQGYRFKLSDLMENLDKEGVIYQGKCAYNLRSKRKLPLVQNDTVAPPKVPRKSAADRVTGAQKRKTTTRKNKLQTIGIPLSAINLDKTFEELQEQFNYLEANVFESTQTLPSIRLQDVPSTSGLNVTIPSQDVPSTSGLNVMASCNGMIHKEWACERCTLINMPFTTKCDVCGFVPPDAAKCAKCQNQKSLEDYQKLLKLEQSQMITNTEKFECKICYMECLPGEGNVLRNCLHSFCRGCLSQTVEFSDDIEIKCPFMDDNYSCTFTMQEREIKHIVSTEIYEKHLAKSLMITENRMKNAFHCKTANCSGWCIIDEDYTDAMIFSCPVCHEDSCIPCQAIHKDMNCKQYQDYLVIQAETCPAAKKTLKYLYKMKKSKKAMNCPTCQVTVMKALGCDWIQCLMCKTDICWATLGPRWGPNGPGDLSGGCGCDPANNKLCTPMCKNCH